MQCFFFSKLKDMEKNNTTFKHPGDLDSEIWEWLKEHGTQETKQVIMMTARHFAGFTVAPVVEARVLKSYNPCSESPDKTYHGIEIVYEDTNKDIPYLKAGDTFKMTIEK